MSIRIGSARHDENGKYRGGKDGDQTGTEVSMQQYYQHSKGWYILRPKSAAVANKLAVAMVDACDNAQIGYDQNQHGTLIQTLKNGYKLAKLPGRRDDDCSGLVRACIYEAAGKDTGAFSTYDEATKLEASGLFEKRASVSSPSQLCNGDVLVTKTKGHTVIVVSGAKSRTASETSASAASISAASASAAYTKTQFIKDVQAATGAKVDGIAGSETLSKTVTISKTKNNRHAVVKPVQKYLNALGYSCGTADGIFGSKTDAAVKKYQKAHGCAQDGEITAKNKTWKKLLGLA